MNKVKVGDKFTDKRGREVVVIEYCNSLHVVIKDNLGEVRRTDSRALRKGWFWRQEKTQCIDEYSGQEIFLGGIIRTRTSGQCEIVSIEQEKVTVKYLDTGNIKTHSIYKLRQGRVADFRKEKKVGDTFQSKQHGIYKIVSISDGVATLEWESGITSLLLLSHVGQSHVSPTRTGMPRVKKEEILKEHKPEPPRLPQFYVYSASLNGELLYIGKGEGNRYLHCNSGKSSCYELNKLHFQGITVDVDIVARYDTTEDAANAEIEMIKRLDPKYNKYNKEKFV